MSKTYYARELADYLLQEGGEDGATIGISDAKLCATALKFYAAARRGFALAAIAAVPLAVVWCARPDLAQAVGFGSSAGGAIVDSAFADEALKPCGAMRSAFAAPL